MSTDKNNFDELIVNSRPLKRIGAPKGNQNARKAKNKDDGGKVKKKKTKKTSGGNSREYWVGRLKRDAPLHLVLLENGEYKSVAEAVRMSGLKKKPLPKPEQMFRDVEKLRISDLEHLVYLAKTRIKELERKCRTAYQVARVLHKKLCQANRNIAYVLDSSKGESQYMSQGTKFMNYRAKFADAYGYTETDGGREIHLGHENLIQFRRYAVGIIDKREYEEFVEKYNLLRIHRLIWAKNNKILERDSLDIKNTVVDDYEDNGPNINPQRLYLNTIQDFLDQA